MVKYHDKMYSRSVRELNNSLSRITPAQESGLSLAADFRSALRAFLRRTGETARRHGLTSTRYDLLLQIRAGGRTPGESTVSELTERLALPQPAVTELVRRAERDGLIRRRRDPSDGRVSRLLLTAEGGRRLLATFDELSEDRERLLTTFSTAAKKLRALAAALE